MRTKQAFAWLSWLTLAAACGGNNDAPAVEATGSPVAVDLSGAGVAAEAAAEQITGDYMRDIVIEISSDAYEGRGPGTAGDEKTRKWLIDEMQRLGLEPGAADGGWEQMFELVSVLSHQPDTWMFSAGDESRGFRQWDDFVVSSGVQESRAEFEDAELVFVGYGMQAPEYDWDDFKDADLEGKVLIIMNNDPDWDPELFAGETRLWYGRWDYKYMKAAEQGARSMQG